MLCDPIFLHLAGGVVRDQGFAPGSPLGRDQYFVVIRVLDRLDESENFVHGSTDWNVLYLNEPERPVLIDNVGGWIGGALLISLLDHAAILFSECLVDIRNERKLDFVQAALLSGSLAPLLVHEVRIDGNTNYLTVELSE